MPPTLMLTLISAAVSLAIGFAGGWTANGWRLGAEIAGIKESQSVAVAQGVKETLSTYTKYIQRKDDALRNAEQRNTQLEAAAAFAGAESGRLRDQLATTTAAIATATDSSVRAYAATANVVLGDCTREYQAMAGQADRHSSSQQTLMDAWPKASTAP